MDKKNLDPTKITKLLSDESTEKQIEIIKNYLFSQDYSQNYIETNFANFFKMNTTYTNNSFTVEINVPYLTTTTSCYEALHIYIDEFTKPLLTPTLNTLRIKAVTAAYGMLIHEAVIFILINDAKYDWEFLTKLVENLPETYSPQPTLNRFKESMQWISETIDMIFEYIMIENSIWENDLKYLLQLICVEQAVSNGFNLDFDFSKSDEIMKAKLKIPMNTYAPRNKQIMNKIK